MDLCYQMTELESFEAYRTSDFHESRSSCQVAISGYSLK